MSRWSLRSLPMWRRRVVRTVLVYVGLMLFLVALGVSPSPVLIGAFFVAGIVVASFVADRFADSHGDAWVGAGQSTLGLSRGGDPRTVTLARRLAETDRDPAQRRHLAGDVQRQLVAVLVDRVQRERGIDLTARPDLAADVLPSDLAQLVTRPPDLRLCEPAYLSVLLDRIETT